MTDAEIRELVAMAVELVLLDRKRATDRDPVSLWEIFENHPRALAMAEKRLECALANTKESR